MSRIDKALRAWEDSVGVVRREEDEGRSGRTTLKDYAQEGERALEAPTLLDRAPAPPDRVPAPIERPRIAKEPASWPAPAAKPVIAPGPSSTPTPVAPPPPLAVPPVVVEVPADVRVDEENAARLITSGSSIVSIEQYRRLAATLHDIQERNGLRTVMVTSAAPAEGKTLTSVNLAYTLSDSYARRVLVIDADLRRPGLHTLLGIGNERGLSEALVDDRMELPLIKVTELFSVLTSGRPVTPLAGLSSPRMRAVLEECERRFDWVIVDTPPVGVLPDAQLVARLTGGVVFVIGAGTTPGALVARAVAELGPECIIGTVLNRVETHIISEAGYMNGYHEKHPAAVS